ncbi:CDP-alcohol phosphatidyltransferase family protein [Erythrobacter sp. SCSIO 43205]|uniref:CDP-alcohol phosphatidyltransferase family protein n=1 Tax=Erythrobacter sp. SCSIO 43205 TaxID=2779361 RepID=UPI001CA9560B|nr:CDP-alcohol phosphatidyltransferase family protein [Erythrobacter sp. SCSIO 43205]UAB77817.1 CDP-alcohol phosphatidyltransferase family protein [Erythrobacter sp. SCSIO 43205]
MGDLKPSVQSAPSLKPRPRELEDWFNFYLYHPLSMRLAKALAPTWVTPDMLSIMGGLMIVMATVAYVGLPGAAGVVLGLALHMSWHVFDGADGDLARLTGRSSSRGEVIDGVCDYVGHITLYVSLGIMLQAEVGAALAWTLAIGAGAGRIVQAAHYEIQRRQYQHWVYGTHFLRSTVEMPDQPKGILGGFAAYYLWLGEILAPGARAVDQLVAQVDGPRLPALRQIIVEETKPVLRSTYLLSANYRTLAIGASMAAGSPIYFFALEAVGLTLVLIVSILVSARAARRIRVQAKSLV